MVIYTSGTTGKPKGAVHTHCGFPIKAAMDMALGLDLRREDTLYWMTDMGWMMGPWEVFGTLLLGATALPLRHLVISMLVGLLPATVIHVYVGSLVRSALELMATNRAEALSPRNIAIGVGGLALTAVFLWLIGQMAKRALARAIAQSTTPEHGGAPLAP